MKIKIIIPIIFLLAMSVVLGLSGGEEILVKSINNCKELNIEVTGTETIDEGEYSLRDCIELESNIVECNEIESNEIESNNWECNEIASNLWNCNCINSTFDLYLETQINTINDYNLTIEYMFQKEVSESEKEIIENIEVINEDIIVEDIKYENYVLELELTGDGEEEVSIYIGDLGKPNKLLINNVNTEFIYENKIIYFTTTFSTKTIKLVFPTPTTTPYGSSDSTTTRFEHLGCSKINYWLKDKECMTSCGDYDDEMMEGKGWEKINYDCFRFIREPQIEEPSDEEEVKGELTTKITPIKEQKNISWIWWLIGIIIIVALGYYFFFKKK